MAKTKIAHLLAKYCGIPITATSANAHGKPSIYSNKKVIKEFYRKVDVILNSGNLKKVLPSTILDVREGIKLIRVANIL